MKFVFKIIILKLFLLFSNVTFADNHNIYEVLEIIKNDLRTLEKAVYSGTIEIQTKSGSNLNTE